MTFVGSCAAGELSLSKIFEIPCFYDFPNFRGNNVALVLAASLIKIIIFVRYNLFLFDLIFVTL